MWLWIEASSFLFTRMSWLSGLQRLYRQGTLDALALYGLLVFAIDNPEIEHHLHLLFPPFLILDVLLKDRDLKTHVFFWAEIIVLGLLVSFGLSIGFVTNPDGGLYFLDQKTWFVSYFWLLFLCSLLNLVNILDGLLPGIAAIICHTLLFALQVQPTINEGSLPFTLALAPACGLFWLYTILGQRKGLFSPVLSSSISILIGILSIVATSKKIALVSVGMTLGIFLLPVVFFAFLIFYTHIQYKFGGGTLAEKPQILWRFTTRSVNIFVIIASLCLNFILMAAILFEGKVLWIAGMSLFSIVLFLRLAQAIFLKRRIQYREIFFPSQDHIVLFGTRIFRGKRERAVELIRELLKKPFRHMHHLVTPDALCLYRTVQDSEFARILNQAWLAIPDGAGVLWTSIFLKERPILERIPGVEFVHDLLRVAEEEALSVYILGAREEILQAALEKLREQHPGLQIAGTRNGYFKTHDEASIIARINDSKAGILLVAMGVPRQEEFLDRHRDQLKVKLGVGIGGSLDVISGKIIRCPKIIQDFGLEWLWRTLKEPWRLTRVWQLPFYILKVLQEKLTIGDQTERP